MAKKKKASKTIGKRYEPETLEYLSGKIRPKTSGDPEVEKLIKKQKADLRKSLMTTMPKAKPFGPLKKKRKKFKKKIPRGR